MSYLNNIYKNYKQTQYLRNKAGCPLTYTCMYEHTHRHTIFFTCTHAWTHTHTVSACDKLSNVTSGLSLREENQVQICLNPEIPSIMAMSEYRPYAVFSILVWDISRKWKYCLHGRSWFLLFVLKVLILSRCAMQTACPGQVASFPPEIPFSSVLLLYSAFLAFSALALPWERGQ